MANDNVRQVFDKDGYPMKIGDEIYFDGMNFFVEHVYDPRFLPDKSKYLAGLVVARKKYQNPDGESEIDNDYLTLCTVGSRCELVGSREEEDETTDAFYEGLEPCPFCGSLKIQGFKYCGRGWYVVCDNCGNMTSAWGSREEAARRWNRRAN